MSLKSRVRTIEHYPAQGIMFRDITTLLKDPIGFQLLIRELVARYRTMEIDVVAGIEARGFILGAPLAYALGAGFVPVRKKGKLPAPTVGQDYQLEYGSDRIEIHVDAIETGQKVLLIDDLIATGGTAEAAAILLRKLGAEIVECAFAIDLPDLGGMQRLHRLGLSTFAATAFEGH